MWDVWETEELHEGLWWEGLRGKRLLGRPRRKWEGNIEMEL